MFKELYNRIKGWVMSFYIGKDSQNTSVLHITGDTESESTLKNGIVTSTVFHSDLTYLSFEEFSPIAIYPKGSTSYSGRTTPGGNMCLFDAAFYNNFSSNPRRMFFMSVEGASYITPILTGTYIRNFIYSVHWYSTSNPDFSSASGVYDSLDYPTSIYKYAFIMSFSTNIQCIVSNYTDGGFITSPTVGNSISLSNTQILIKGVDIRTYKYLSIGTINAIDPTISINGNTYQRVNSVYKYGATSIYSNGSSVGGISVGGVPIFKETSPHLKLTAGRRYANTIRWGPGTNSYVLLSSVPIGAIILVKIKRVFVGVASSPSYIRVVYSTSSSSSLVVLGPSSTLTVYIQSDTFGNLIFKVVNSQSWTYDWDVEIDEFA